ncbi:hypothetical protein BH24CHL4_BH24CHL4_19520 [soil metagenome]
MIETTCKECKTVYTVTLPDLAKGAAWWRLCPDCRPDDTPEAA